MIVLTYVAWFIGLFCIGKAMSIHLFPPFQNRNKK